MFKVTRFYVQRQSSGATVADPETFTDQASALRRGAQIGRRTVARVYAVTGEPFFNLWDRPRLIAEYGGRAPVTEPTDNVLQFRRAG